MCCNKMRFAGHSSRRAARRNPVAGNKEGRAMPYADVNDIRMYYEEAGQGEPLVLLLGATGGIEFPPAAWSALVPAFAERHRTFHVEQRGHGRTDNPSGRLSYGQMASDTAELIESLGLEPVHVAGTSDGGIVGLTLGMTRPDLLRSLVCVGTNYRLDDTLIDLARESFSPEAMERDAPAWVEALVAVHDPHHSPGYWRDLVTQLQAMLLVEPAYTEADLRHIPVPTLLIAGETDHYASLDQMLEMRRSIPRSELLILNHAGMDATANHIVQHTRAEVVGPVVLEFLARQMDPDEGP
jgi:pimeloyl-ACP methyl ester carboxylesterase